jgi:predicted nucleic acid-binding Zn ribbon protein
MMRKGTSEPIGDVVKKVIEKLDPTKQKKSVKIISAWRAVAGRELAQHTKPVGLRKNSLLVVVDDSAWFYQVNLKKEELLAALKKKKGCEKIEKVRFRIGKA